MADKQQLFLSFVSIFVLLIPVLGMGYVYGSEQGVFKLDLGDTVDSPISNFDNLVLDNSTLSGDYVACIWDVAVPNAQVLSGVSTSFWNDKTPNEFKLWLNSPNNVQVKIIIARKTVEGAPTQFRYIHDSLSSIDGNGDYFLNLSLTNSDKVFMANNYETNIFFETPTASSTNINGDDFSIDYVVTYDTDVGNSLMVSILLILSGIFYIVMALFMTPWLDVSMVRRSIRRF